MRWTNVGAAATAALLIMIAPVASAAGASGKPDKTVWLCLPGQTPDPCTPGLSTTVYSPTLKQLGTQNPAPTPNPAIDCFYVYPTVSSQPTGNSNLEIGPEQRSIALQQAARYSQYCRVYAPMYKQVTLAGNGTPGTKPPTVPKVRGRATASVRTAFQNYLRNYNHGRGIVFIGQSQGAVVLRSILAKDVDPVPSVRKLLVSAILLGGSVLVKKGQDVGGDFQNIHACHSATQTGCVIAFSTFDQPVPATTLFGRPRNPSGGPIPPGVEVLCTNPAALGGGSGLLDTIQSSRPFDPASLLAKFIAQLGMPLPRASTVWVEQQDSYRAQCSSANNANVLQITAVGGAKLPTPSPTPDWGLHLLDAQIALGNLVSDVGAEATAYAAHAH